jgi:radial spoke head protein 9
MDSDKMSAHLQYVERNGNTLNIDEKMKLGLAIMELKTDMALEQCWMFAKITGIVKDYFIVIGKKGKGQAARYWCSSSSWVFS